MNSATFVNPAVPDGVGYVEDERTVPYVKLSVPYRKQHVEPRGESGVAPVYPLSFDGVCGIVGPGVVALENSSVSDRIQSVERQGEPAVAFVDSAVFERICRIQRVGAVSAVDRPVPVADIYMWRRSAAHPYRRLRYFRGRPATGIAVFRVIGHSVSWPAVFTGDAGITPCQNPRSRIICLKRFFTTRMWNGRMRLK